MTILKIKTEKFADPGKLAWVGTELQQLRAARDDCVPPSKGTG